MTIRTTMSVTKRATRTVKSGNITRTTISIDSELHAFGKRLAIPLRNNFSLAIEQLLRKAKESQEAAA